MYRHTLYKTVCIATTKKSMSHLMLHLSRKLCVMLNLVVLKRAIVSRPMLAGFSGGQRCIQVFGVALMRTQVTSGMTCGGISRHMKIGTNARSQTHGDLQQDLD